MIVHPLGVILDSAVHAVGPSSSFGVHAIGHKLYFEVIGAVVDIPRWTQKNFEELAPVKLFSFMFPDLFVELLLCSGQLTAEGFILLFQSGHSFRIRFITGVNVVGGNVCLWKSVWKCLDC